MEAKTNASATKAGKLGLKINIKKTRHLRMSGRTNESIMVNGEVAEEVDHFTYLGSKEGDVVVVHEDGVKRGLWKMGVVEGLISEQA